MSTIYVVIPYLASGAQGLELTYAVTGWRRHFKENFQIVIVGDWHPCCASEDIIFIKCPQVKETGRENYRPHIDHVNKFRAFLRRFPSAKGFIYACDDMYAVNDFDMSDVLFLKKLSDDIKGNPDSSNGWQRDAWKTRSILKARGLPYVNYVCHLPVYYEKKKLLAIWKEYDCDHNSYIVEDLYFNTYYSNRVAFQISQQYDNLKFGIYDNHPDLSALAKAFSTKIWISNSPPGWVPALEEMLVKHYAGNCNE